MHSPEVEAPGPVNNGPRRIQRRRCRRFHTSPLTMGILVCVASVYALIAFYTNNVDAAAVPAKPFRPPSKYTGADLCQQPSQPLHAYMSYEYFLNRCPAPTAVELAKPCPIRKIPATHGLAPTPRPRRRERKTKAKQGQYDGSARVSSRLPKRRIIVKKMPEVSWRTLGGMLRIDDPQFPLKKFEALLHTYVHSRLKQFPDTAARPPHNHIAMSPDPFDGHDAFSAARSVVPKDTPATRWPVFGSEEFWTSMGELLRAPDVDLMLNPDRAFGPAFGRASERSRKKPSLEVAARVPDNTVSNSHGLFRLNPAFMLNPDQAFGRAFGRASERSRKKRSFEFIWPDKHARFH